MLRKMISVWLALSLFACSVLSVNADDDGLVSAPAAVLMEASTGKILYEKNPHEQRPCASITKVMTLLLVMEAMDSGKLALTDTITAGEHASSMGGSDIWLEPGETMSADDMIKATVVASANDAAVALVDEVSLWPRVLSAEEMTAARAAFLAGGAAAAGAAAGKGGWDKTLLLRWEFEEAGKAPTAADSSNAKRDGSAKDRVRGGAPGRKSGTKAYDGFGSEGSFVLSGPLPENAFRQEWTIAMWMKNPRLSTKQACVLAGAAPDPKTGDFGWQVWIDGKGVPHVAMMDAKAKRYVKDGKPFRWEPNKWHLVVISHLPDRDEFKQPSNRFRVWIVPETGAVPEALFDGLVGWGAAMESGVSLLQVGAAQPGKGKRSEIAPGGYFGGLIDDVTFYLGAAAVQADVETLRAGPAR